MNVTSDEVCITRGSQMALYLIAHALLTQKDIVLVENPGYQPAWKAFKSAGAVVVPIGVDDEGLMILEVEAMLQKKSNIKAIYITPHHQYPTTVSLSLKRRLKLVELSNKYNFIIIEDDYDYEFHFDHRPILPISSLSSIKNYVYIGTFSKIIAPSLRIGFLVCNVELINKIASLREIIDVQSDSIMERAISELIQNGDIKRHLKRASKNYIEKREYCDNLLRIHLKDKTHYNTPTGGLAFWIRPLKSVSLKDLTIKLEMNGIQITDASKYCIENSFRGFRLGYGSLSKNELEKVIIKLSELL
jgi:GntR family transcriptional regulator/MocR family aminotransferase